MSAKEKKGYFTFMLIPHSEGKIYRIRIPRFLLQVCGFLLTLILLYTGYYYWDYGRVKSYLPELHQLRETNQRQQKQIENLAEQAVELQEKLSELDELELKVRELLDSTAQKEGREAVELASRGAGGDVSRRTAALDQEEGTNLARGGGEISGENTPAQLDAVAESFNAIEMQLDTYRENLEEMISSLEERQAYLEAKPSIWPARGRITSRYGYRRSPFSGKREFHQGIDIAAPRGTPIVATGAGVVTFAGWRTGYGRVVIIDHGYGYRTLYGHNDSIKVKVGQRVSKGQVIAYMGSSGRSTGTHVHYEVHVNGSPTNPANYM